MLWENRHSLEGTSAKSSKNEQISIYTALPNNTRGSSYVKLHGIWLLVIHSIPWESKHHGVSNPYQWIMTGLMTTAGLRDTTNGKHGTYAATYG